MASLLLALLMVASACSSSQSINSIEKDEATESATTPDSVVSEDPPAVSPASAPSTTTSSADLAEVMQDNVGGEALPLEAAPNAVPVWRRSLPDRFHVYYQDWADQVVYLDAPVGEPHRVHVIDRHGIDRVGKEFPSLAGDAGYHAVVRAAVAPNGFLAVHDEAQDVEVFDQSSRPVGRLPLAGEYALRWSDGGQFLLVHHAKFVMDVHLYTPQGKHLVQFAGTDHRYRMVLSVDAFSPWVVLSDQAEVWLIREGREIWRGQAPVIPGVTKAGATVDGQVWVFNQRNASAPAHVAMTHTESPWAYLVPETAIAAKAMLAPESGRTWIIYREADRGSYQIRTLNRRGEKEHEWSLRGMSIRLEAVRRDGTAGAVKVCPTTDQGCTLYLIRSDGVVLWQYALKDFDKLIMSGDGQRIYVVDDGELMAFNGPGEAHSPDS